MDMIERVARAIHGAECRFWGREMPFSLGLCREQAAAAIEAMREPTEAMVEAGLTTSNRFGRGPMARIWRTMIEAA